MCLNTNYSSDYRFLSYSSDSEFVSCSFSMLRGSWSFRFGDQPVLIVWMWKKKFDDGGRPDCDRIGTRKPSEKCGFRVPTCRLWRPSASRQLTNMSKKSTKCWLEVLHHQKLSTPFTADGSARKYPAFSKLQILSQVLSQVCPKFVPSLSQVLKCFENIVSEWPQSPQSIVYWQLRLCTKLPSVTMPARPCMPTKKTFLCEITRNRGQTWDKTWDKN